MENSTFEIAAAIERGIVDQAKYLGTLTTAIFGAMVALCLQFKLSGIGARWLLAFWVATVLAIPTTGLVFAISGLMIELTPVLYVFPFDTEKEFSSQNFECTRIGVLTLFSRFQLCTFIVFLVSGGAFVLRNVVGRTSPITQGDE